MMENSGACHPEAPPSPKDPRIRYNLQPQGFFAESSLAETPGSFALFKMTDEEAQAALGSAPARKARLSFISHSSP